MRVALKANKHTNCHDFKSSQNLYSYFSLVICLLPCFWASGNSILLSASDFYKFFCQSVEAVSDFAEIKIKQRQF